MGTTGAHDHVGGGYAKLDGRTWHRTRLLIAVFHLEVATEVGTPRARTSNVSAERVGGVR